ncbi:serine hydroxymethyltransferase, cytosolic [Candidozyma haemuli]|uniref:Serine hydroxymethyltransferase n=1 Tax=Candidozyma haemuli TaxID=45357 RepID=A0A2V1ATW8_9ASCO|nr:serine hydroxymethyltransferase, cytosolic [[Candida] haemuloni]PVH21607.1 serine hydroxymethyltransferase, cytosolic [[Candida] haemuloni]
MVILPDLQGKLIKDVVVGDYHFLAITEAGELLSWGLESQSNGCLGLGRMETLDNYGDNIRREGSGLRVTNPVTVSKPTIEPDTLDTKIDQSLNPNLNADWVHYKGAWIIHIVLIIFVKLFYDFITVLDNDWKWALTNVTYNIGSYIMFHQVKGTPFEFNSGAYDNLTMWEQIDNGDQYTPTKKFLMMSSFYIPNLIRKAKVIYSTEMPYNLSDKHKQLVEGSLPETDPEVNDIINDEISRQKHSIVLIASENFTTKAVFDALGTPMCNKYSEGYPGARYYGGNEHIDRMERLCQSRALKAFHVSPEKWGVNVQTLSGSPANLQVYQAIMKPHERLMGLDLPHGGHLSHGYQTDSRKISAVSTYFETMPYRVDLETGLIDYDMLEKTAVLYRPKVLVAGTSAYCRLIDYKKMREIADKVGAYLVVDMAHISGLVAAGVIPSPFEYADIVTTTTHKSLRGPRGAMIFFRRGVRSVNPKTGQEVLYDLENPINFSVFPGHQGGPHNHTIAALATALKQAATPEFKLYQEQVLKNAKVLETEFLSKDYSLVSNGTDSHMVLVSLRDKQIDGARVEAICELINIALNKNSIPGDKSALVPGGVRIGMGEDDFKKIVEYIDFAVNYAKKVQASLPKEANRLKDFKEKILQHDEKLEAIKSEIHEWVGTFPLSV